MVDKLQFIPENIVYVVLHRAGLETLDDGVLSQVLGQAAQAHQIFSEFRPHPQYKDNPKLDQVLDTLLLGGSVIREGLTRRIRPAPHLLGEYGSGIYAGFTKGQQREIDKAAKILKERSTKI